MAPTGEQTAAHLGLLRRIAEIANAAESVHEAAAGCIDLVRSFTGWPVGHLFTLDPASGRLVSSRVWRAEDEARYAPFLEATATTELEPGQGLAGWVVERRRPSVIDELGSEPRFLRAQAAERCGLRSGFAFPVIVRGDVVAVIEFFSAGEAPPDADELEVLDQVGRQLGVVFERERHAAALAESEDHARSVIEAASDAFVSIDERGIVQAWNRAAERTFGWSPQEAVGTPVHELIVPERYRGAHLAGIARFLHSGEGPLLGRRTEIAALHRNGHELPVELAVWAVQRDDAWTFNAFLVDITERRVAQRELQAAYERERDMVAQLTQLDRNKADFMSMVSHELRTPLTSIIGYLDLLDAGHGGALTDRQRDMLGVVERNAHRLLDLIDDIVTLDRLESGRVPLELAPVSLADLVHRAVESVAPLAAAREQRLTTDVREGVGEVVGDAEQLERVLLNLATNAVKFTPKGGAVNVVADGDGEAASVTVLDTGMGIPAEEQPKLFSRFFRSSTARAAAVPGTGLGLVIARSIVEAHGGAIELVSAEGEGTVVTVRLPRRQDVSPG